MVSAQPQKHIPNNSLTLFLFFILLTLLASCTPPNRPTFIDDSGNPIATETLRLLCFSTETDTTPTADINITTDTNGKPVDPLPETCNFVAAMRPIHTQPSAYPDHDGPAFTVYETSWTPGQNERQSTSDKVIIHQDTTIVLFDVVVSLAWTPNPDSNYLTQLETGFREASNYLANLTEGQMAFGTVTVHTGGEKWLNADIRVLAANDLRPSAFVGGIAPVPTSYVSPVNNFKYEYTPAAIFLGRYWNGDNANDAATGSWDQPDAYRTLVHEWGHYALFLYDEYRLDTSGNLTYCTCDDLPAGVCTPPNLQASAMAFHYEAQELWHPVVHNTPPACKQTQQWLAHGKSDWEALDSWYQILGLPIDPIQMVSTLSPSLNNSLLLNLFAYQAISGGAAASTTDVTVNVDVPVATGETAVVHVYTLKNNTNRIPEQILYEGTVIVPDTAVSPPTITLLGISPTDTIHFMADHYNSTGGKRSFMSTPSPANGDTIPLTPTPFLANLDVTYQVTGSDITSLTIYLTQTNTTTPPLAHLCQPDANIGCNEPTWQTTMTLDTEGRWTATFTPRPGTTSFPRYLILRVVSEDGEFIRWVMDGGGVGPAHDRADAPLRDGNLMVDAQILPDTLDCNRVMLMPAANGNALTLLDGFAPVAVPMDVDVVMANGANCTSEEAGTREIPAPVSFSLAYNLSDLSEVGIRSSLLSILQWQQSALLIEGGWTPIGAIKLAKEVVGAEQQEIRPSPGIRIAPTTPLQTDGIFILTTSEQ